MAAGRLFFGMKAFQLSHSPCGITCSASLSPAGRDGVRHDFETGRGSVLSNPGPEAPPRQQTTPARMRPPSLTHYRTGFFNHAETCIPQALRCSRRRLCRGSLPRRLRQEKAPAAAASSAAPKAAGPAKVKVAVTAGPHADIVTKAAEVAKKNGLDVEVVEFTDYITPDTALAEKQLDIAVYQHEPFLQNFNRQKGTNLVVAAKAVVQPMGLYSNKIHALDAIPEGAKVAIPNDPSNGGRAIILLEKAGLVKVKEGAPALPTVHDVAENPKNLQLVELEAAQLPISISDLDIACVPMNYAVSGGLDVKKQGFYFESFDAPFALIIIAARPDNVESEPVKAFVKAYQSPEVAEFIRGKFNGQILPAWEAQK